LRCGNNWFDEPTELAPAVQTVLPDYVIHLHAAITTACDQAALEETVQTNLLPSIALMMACMEMKLKRVILMGSRGRVRFSDRTLR
jgi:nucleoside-diphosphate-sugar epimerase